MLLPNVLYHDASCFAYWSDAEEMNGAPKTDGGKTKQARVGSRKYGRKTKFGVGLVGLPSQEGQVINSNARTGFTIIIINIYYDLRRIPTRFH
eukprot:scaffold34567_cov114-Skeletonema_dohrnii-CCMP3373.AAC.1